MKRTALLLSVVSAFGALTIACSDSPSALEGQGELPERGSIAGGDGDGDDEKTSTDKTDPAPAKQSQSNAPPPVTTSANTATCDPKAAKTAAECTKCCAEKAAPAGAKDAVNDCACGAGSKCGEACGDSLCGGGGFPSLECGLCLLQAKCDLGDVGGNLGGDQASDAAECFQICEDKP